MYIAQTMDKRRDIFDSSEITYVNSSANQTAEMLDVTLSERDPLRRRPEVHMDADESSRELINRSGRRVFGEALNEAVIDNRFGPLVICFAARLRQTRLNGAKAQASTHRPAGVFRPARETRET
jgi:hypothetical protein